MLMEDSVYTALQRCPLFAGMERMEIVLALNAFPCRIVDYARHEIYALAGLPLGYADIVVSGTLVCRMASLHGRPVEMTQLKKGDMVAPALLFAENGVMPVSVETDSKVRVLRMTKEDFQEMMDKNSRLRMNFIRLLSTTCLFLTKRTRMLALMTVREKVAFFLLKEARGQKSQKIVLPRSRQEIADSFGIQKYSLKRVLAEMEKEGILMVDGREITILKPEELK